MKSWLQNHNTSPITKSVLQERHYIPNRALKSLIQNFLAQKETSRRILTDEFLGFNIRGIPICEEWKGRSNIKLVISLLGASGVGKTTLGHSLKYGKWPANMTFPPHTIGADLLFYHLDKLILDQHVLVIEVNDPPGQERFEAVTKSFFVRCHGALLLADTTRLSTLERIEQYWYPRLKELGMSHVQTTLVCTKLDLYEHQAKKDQDAFQARAEHFASANQIPIVHVSSTRGDNVEHVFKQLIIRILENETLVHDLIRQTLMSENLRMIEARQRARLDRMRRRREPICCD